MAEMGEMMPFVQGVTGLLGILQQQNLEQEAKAKELAKYNKLMQIVGGPRSGGHYGRQMQRIANIIADARSVEGKKIREAASAARGAGTANAVGRGMYGTTAAMDVNLRAKKAETLALAGLANRLAQSRNVVDATVMGQRLGIIGSRIHEAGMSPWLAASQLFGAMRPAPQPETPEDRSILGAATGGTIGAAGAIAGGIIATSDEDAKVNIEPIEDASYRVEEMRAVRFEYKDKPGDVQYGTIAQDVEIQFPELVETDIETGYKKVNYQGLIGVLMAALQEQAARLRELEQRVG